MQVAPEVMQTGSEVMQSSSNTLQVGPLELFKLAGMPITDTMIVGLVISVFLVVAGFLIGRRAKMIPGRIQVLAEMFITSFVDLIDGIIPNRGRAFFPMVGTIMLFITLSNIVGIVPLVANPTADINTTFAYAGVVFVVSHYQGIKSKGFGGWFKSFFEPMPFLAPLNVIGELAKPLSHSFRLFGNVLGGGILMGVAMMFVPWLIPVPLMAWFDLFVGVIQAFIFAILAVVYISVQRE